jgi:hypothetical protein
MNVMYFPKLMPSGDDQPVCTSMMSRIDDLAPYNSNINAIINLLADGTYHTSIAIHAFCGQFNTEATTSSLVSSLGQAQKSMLAELTEWKKRRFQSEA